MFGSIEWSQIRAAIAAHFPEASPCISWMHRQPAVVQLPDGSELTVDRGAEQGDPFGSTLASLALGDGLDVARSAFLSSCAAARDGHETGHVDQGIDTRDQLQCSNLCRDA
eukprot:4491593-Karenia_brevis.AAC.1